jgi:acetyl-CoA/propionyl-CoA carboxylase biotin carboxyl carrier protein
VASDGSRRRITIELDGKAVRLGLPAGLFLAGAGVAGPGTVDGGGPGSAGAAAGASGAKDEGAVTAPVAGTLAAWRADDGATVVAGDAIAAIEAMKMETVVRASRDGVVHLSGLSAGDAVERGQELARVG